MSLRVYEAVASDAPLLRNLGELYAYDFSEILGIELNDAGRFDPNLWGGCWKAAGGARTPYLLRVDQHLAGFAILARGSRLTEAPDVHDVAEFFVVRRYRRRGVGLRAAAELFRLRPGRWEVRERHSNVAARAFWRKAIGEYTAGVFEESLVVDEQWHGWVQRFVSGAPRAPEVVP